MPAVAIPIFLLTISLALVRPQLWRIKFDHATAALLGAFLTIVSGALPLDGVQHALSVLVQPVILIISLMILTLAAEKAGLFEVLAFYIATAAKGDARKLFAYIFLAGTVTGALFTNDAAVLIFTPLVFKLIEDVGGKTWSLSNKLPYYFAVLCVANLVGAFVISNPINILAASFFEIHFLEYASWMMFPAVVSMIVTYFVLWVFFRKSLPQGYDPPRAALPISGERRRFMVVSGCVLIVTLLGFFTDHLTEIPTWLIAFSSAMALLIYSAAIRPSSALEVIQGVGWDVIVFVVGIFIVVSGLKAAGLTEYLTRMIVLLSGTSFFSLTMVNGFAAAVSAAIMNNHPTIHMLAFTIEDLPLDPLWLDADKMWTKRMLVFSALIGADLGPKMLPIGSLAALIWFRILKDKGVAVSYSQYIKIGVPVTLAAVLLSLLALNLEIALVKLFFVR